MKPTTFRVRLAVDSIGAPAVETFDVTLDVDSIARLLASKALRNKSGFSAALGGAVIVQHIKRYLED